MDIFTFGHCAVWLKKTQVHPYVIVTYHELIRDDLDMMIL